MDIDERIRLATRILSALAFLTFLAWILLANLVPWLFLAALALALVAYGFYLTYQRRNPFEGGGYGRDSEDRVETGSDMAVIPGLSAGGIHLTFETRSRWRSKR
ncbi:MAG TPA: hypothetical protein VGR51_03005 [Thermoplasmata archaeon]|nr:hypothetical protein [Thermoplasmata archaeon]